MTKVNIENATVKSTTDILDLDPGTWFLDEDNSLCLRTLTGSICICPNTCLTFTNGEGIDDDEEYLRREPNHIIKEINIEVVS